MAKVALVTDSTANIPDELASNYPIFIAPLQLIWGSRTYRDGVDITPAEFYTRLPQSKIMPTTSQPAPSVFVELYKKLLDQGYDVLSVHISSKLSGTVASALQAKDQLPKGRIEVVDSTTTAMAMGFPILLAARAAVQNATLQECKTLAERALTQSGVFFAVSTLEYLRRGGRIGGAAAFLGTALNLKPILELKDGHVDAIERVRTMNKAIDRLLDLVVDRVGGRTPIHIAALHGNTPNEANLLLERARQRFNLDDVADAVMADVGPVLGAHAGPGVMGLAFMAGL